MTNCLQEVEVLQAVLDVDGVEVTLHQCCLHGRRVFWRCDIPLQVLERFEVKLHQLRVALLNLCF